MKAQKVTLYRIANGWLIEHDNVMFYEKREEALERLAKLAVMIENRPPPREYENDR